MRRGMLLAGLGLLLAPAFAHAQFTEFSIDPRLGPLPTFGPGGYISNYKGYGAPGGGYWVGLPMPGNDLGNGPSSYYSPLYSALAAAPGPVNRAPGLAGWRLDPSLPDHHLFRRRKR